MKIVTIELEDDFGQVVTAEVECNYYQPEPEVGYLGGWTAEKVVRASISVYADFTNHKELIIDLDVNEIDLDPESVQEQIDSLV